MGNFDFSGWATRANVKCSDGRTILKGAFKNNSGETVPLVWNHRHDGVANVLGHALLTDKDEGVWADCTFNDTPNGDLARKLVRHGDIVSMSIWANEIVENLSVVSHGNIREVSLVLAGANPGAKIDTVMAHGEAVAGEALIYFDQELVISHSADEKTQREIFDSLTDEQKDVVYAMLAQASGEDDEEDSEKDSDDKSESEPDETGKEKNKSSEKETNDKEDDEKDSKGGNKNMKHNVFDQEDSRRSTILSHEAQGQILEMAKSVNCGSLQSAMEKYAADNNLQHDATSGGFVQTGEGNVTLLFPEYKDVRPGEPELITNDQGWISVVMNKVHKSPIARIRTSQVDIRNIDALRAKGYTKGKQKKLSGNFNLIHRTTDPHTVYVKNALHRDDIIDITDFDYVSYLYKIDRMMLEEELALAIMLGDGREDGDEGKIAPDHIRPIWLDDDLYTLHVDIDRKAAEEELQGTGTGTYFGENFIRSEAMVNTVLYAREKYKGTGTPDMFITPHELNVMLLARDISGRRIYSSKAELASALNVGNIYTVEQFEGKVRTTDDNKKKKLKAIIANLSDYSLGATKGGEITHFTQFDIDFNQQKSLLETRCSGALTRVYSAIAIEEDVTPASGGGSEESQG